MDSLHVASLRIAGFRGIQKDLALEFGRRLTIVYGGNATGKSSIAQAIEFAISGQVLDHENNPVPARYLANVANAEKGVVTLSFTGGISGIPLRAQTDESRNEIEQRFRQIASVDWPDRQRVPITTTHLTSQGALASVLASDSVTRNDLSSLCAGAYLRFLLLRAERLSDQFRQAATGRNMQSAIKDARAEFEATRMLRDSLAATRGATFDSSLDGERLVKALAAQTGHPELVDLASVVATIGRRYEELDRKLDAIHRLLSRMGELGQYEVELTQLRTAVTDSVAEESTLLTKREEIKRVLEREAENAVLAATRRERAVATITAHERYQQSVAAIESLNARLIEVKASAAQASESAISITARLEASIKEQQQGSERVVRIESARRRCAEQLLAVSNALHTVGTLSEEAVSLGQRHVIDTANVLTRLRGDEAAVASRLEEATNAVGTVEATLERESHDERRFVSAVSELRSLIEDDACTLCGHLHGSGEALNSAIDSVVGKRLLSTSHLRDEFERAATTRRELADTHALVAEQLRSAEQAAVAAANALQGLLAQRSAAIALVQDSLLRHELKIDPSIGALAKARDDLTARLARETGELEAASHASRDSTTARDDLEQESAKRRVERDQLSRLALELQTQVDDLRREQPDVVGSEAPSGARKELVEIDNLAAETRRSIGSANALMVETDRAIAERSARRVNAQRRLSVIEGLLTSMDADLRDVGAATRDIGVLLQLEATTRRERDEITTLQAKATGVQQQLAEIEKHRAYRTAEQRYATTLATMERLQKRQLMLSQRAEQFSTLRSGLENVQNSTAQAVLENVRIPVGVMFRAMTAGCQWDIQFVLTDEGQVEARLRDSAGRTIPASAVLNSAYLNVAAIALRVALASQQNWTSLRTVVLDDPILEMDSLTQSALIDGLEAILTSPHPPWNNLQIVITTWSEDFAVLAAHKLAHMNRRREDNRDAFVVYRLTSESEGTVMPERHAPRWRERASAA